MSIVKDAIVGTAKGVISTIPGASILVAIADEIQNGILQERFTKWKDAVDQKLNEIDNLNIAELSKNEVFATVLLLSAQLALKTNSAKKIYLANAVKNSAIKDYSEEQVIIMLNCIEKYTVEHIRLLRFLQDPSDYNPSDSIMMGSPMRIFDDYYPNRIKDYDSIIMRDLFFDGLTNTESLNGMMTLQGCLAKRTTPLGDEFIDFFGIEIM